MKKRTTELLGVSSIFAQGLECVAGAKNSLSGSCASAIDGGALGVISAHLMQWAAVRTCLSVIDQGAAARVPPRVIPEVLERDLEEGVGGPRVSPRGPSHLTLSTPPRTPAALCLPARASCED